MGPKKAAIPQTGIWRTEPLGKHCDVRARIGWRGLSSSEYKEDGPFLIAGKHVEGGRIDWDACDHISEHRYRESQEIALKDGDVILTKDGTIGRAARVDRLPGDATINGTMMLLRPAQTLHYRFLFHLLGGQAFKKLIEDKVSGSSIPHVFQRDMVTLPIAFPQTVEQIWVSDVLDTIDTAIHQSESIIEKLKQVKQGLMHDLFTRGVDENGELRPPQSEAPHLYQQSPLGWIPKEWTNRAIESLVVAIIDYRGKTPPKSNHGVPLITAKNVRIGFIDPEPREFLSEVTYGRWMTRGFPKRGDVLFTTEAPMGNVAEIESDAKLAFAQRIIILQPINEVPSAYLKYRLMSTQFQTVLVRFAAGTTALGIKQSTFRKLAVPIPSKPREMIEVAHRLKSLDDRITEEFLACRKLREQSVGLADDLLTGRVRVTPLLVE